ncbi:MAG: phytanoyl-CoA dioxygenase family protein [Bacteroidetes bacterium]|nr:phytanoyl-CoA dioxygenase family protein [Bacteroidota bacterium]
MGFLSRFLGKKKIEKKVEYPNIFNQNMLTFNLQLDLNGIWKIDLLDEKTLSQLLDIYKENPKPNIKDFGFHLSVELEDNLQANKIAEEISSKIKEKTDGFFVDYKYISPRFAVKEPNSNSLIPPHQDWTFVDESKFQSYNLWIALVDINETNGTLGFLKGSTMH